MSPEFWERHWWLIIVLAGMTVPIAGVLFNAWSSYLYYQHRRDALDTLKSYTAQGKTPPPEVVEALGGRSGPPPSGFDDGPPWTEPHEDLGTRRGRYYSDREARRAERYAWRTARWRAREPYRRWNSAVWLVALTAGFGFASQHSEAKSAEAFLLVAIIVGALAVGAIITALIATFLRPGQ